MEDALTGLELNAFNLPNIKCTEKNAQNMLK
jgi:hypothetical protein